MPKQARLTTISIFLLILNVLEANTQSKMKIENQMTKLEKGQANKGNGRVVRLNFDVLTRKLVLTEPANYVGEGGSIDIIIENFNPFLYSLSIKERQGQYQNQENLSEKNYSSITMNPVQFQLKDLTINYSAIPTTATSYSFSSSLPEEIDKLNVELKNTKQQINDLGTEIEHTNRMLIDTSSAIDKAALFAEVQRKQNEISRLKKAHDSIELDVKKKENEFNNKVKENNNLNDLIIVYNSRVSHFFDKLLSLTNISDYYRTLTNTISIDGISFKDIDESKRANFKNYFPDWNSKDDVNISSYLNKLIREIQKEYHQLTVVYGEVEGKIPVDDPKKIRDPLKTGFREIKATYEKINISAFEQLIDRIDKLFLAINPHMYRVVYSTYIIDDDADIISFEIESKPLSGADPNIPVQPLNLSFGVPIQGGVKFQVGTGFAFNVGPYNKTYRYEKSDTSTSYRVVENKNESLFEPTIIVMAHLYRRNSSKNHSPGVSVGIGTSDAERIRYYFGLSWRFGRKQWMNFAVGAVGGQVDRASESVLNKNLSPGAEEITKEIPLLKPAPFKIGGFFGITFNLTGSNSVFAQKALQGK